MLRVIIFLLLSRTSAASGQFGIDATIEPILQTWLKSHPDEQPEIIGKAIQILDAYHDASSCSQLALDTLHQSCQTFKHDDSIQHGQDHIELDFIKDTFAARIALCELASAQTSIHNTIPKACTPLLPVGLLVEKSRILCMVSGAGCKKQQNPTQKKDRAFHHVSKSQVQTCFSAMVEQPQSWTSYSNARQNAWFMCHAARSEIRQEKYIDTAENVIATMADAAQTYQEMMSRVHTKAMKDLEERKHQTEIWLQYVIFALQEGLTEHIDALKQASEDVVDLRKHVNETSALHAFQQKLLQTNLQTNLDSTGAIQSSLQKVFQSVVLAVADVQNELDDFKQHSELAHQASLEQQENTTSQLQVLNGNLDKANTNVNHIDRAVARWESFFNSVDSFVAVKLMWLLAVIMATAVAGINKTAGAYAFLVVSSAGAFASGMIKQIWMSLIGDRVTGQAATAIVGVVIFWYTFTCYYRDPVRARIGSY